MHIEHVLLKLVLGCKSQMAVVAVMVVVPLNVVLVVHNSFEVGITVRADFVIRDLDVLLVVEHDMMLQFFLARETFHTTIKVACERSFVHVVCFHVPFQVRF